ncbi:MAG: hypothetical protein Q8Q39_04425 [bacterium]|nr:hypothetical protein [bacterium]
MFTDTYVARSLLLETTSGKLIWQAVGESGSMFGAEVRKENDEPIRIRIWESADRTGSRVCASLFSRKLLSQNKPCQCSIIEPYSAGIFGRSYKNDGDKELAELLRALYRAVMTQCAGREPKDDASYEAAKQSIFSELFG